MSEHFRCANINQPEHNTVRLIDFRTKLEPNKYYAFYLHTPPKLEVKNKEDKIEQKNNFSFDVFLSHNNQDKPIVRELAQELLSYNLRVWLDEEQLLPGRSWHEGLNQDFQKFGAAAVLIGPNGLGPWQAKEIEACISESVARKLPVIPVFLPGAPDNPNLPIFLGHLTYVDLRNGLTKAGLEKLIWGITGSKHVHVKSLEVCSHPIGSYFEEIGYTFEKPLFDDLENWTPKGDKFILLTATKEEINHFPNIIFSVSGKLRNSLAEDKFVGSFVSLNQCTVYDLFGENHIHSGLYSVEGYLLWYDGGLWDDHAWLLKIDLLKENLSFEESQARQRLAWIGAGWMSQHIKDKISNESQESWLYFPDIDNWANASLKNIREYERAFIAYYTKSNMAVPRREDTNTYISALCNFLPYYYSPDRKELFPSNHSADKGGPKLWIGRKDDDIDMHLWHLILDGWVTLWPFKEENGNTRLYYQPSSMALLYWAARRLDKPWTNTPKAFLDGYDWSDPHWFGGNWHYPWHKSPQPSASSIVTTHQRGNAGNDSPATPVREAAHPGSHTGACEPEKDDKIRILHLSDLHFDGYTQVKARLQWLLDDIRKGDCLGIKKLDCLVVTGDFTDRCNPDGFDKAYQFITELTKEFGLNADRCILVPGNHDVAGKIEDIYEISHNADGLKEDEYIKEGIIVLKKNPEKYRLRFKPYSENLFSKLAGKDYPIEPTEQGLVVSCWDLGIQFLALNSCWQIDGHPANRKRSGIHADALANALWEANTQEVDARANGKLGENASVLRIAVWHHAVAGPEMMKNVQFLGHLPNHGVKLGLHGDIHEYQREQIGHWLGDKKLHIAGCGSFGAPREGLPDSTPRLYNLLEISRELNSVRIHTRCQPKPDGLWKGWYEWPTPGGEGRVPYYDISWTKNS